MTTIAYRDSILASDTGIVLNQNYMSSSESKIGFLSAEKLSEYALNLFDGPVSFGWSGDVTFGVCLIGFLQNGSLLDVETPNSLGIIINKKQHIYIIDERFIPYRLNEKFYAIGSGMDYAVGAMHFGASAVDSIKVASRCNICTNISKGISTIDTRTGKYNLIKKNLKI